MAAASPPEGARAAAFILHPGRTCWKRARADRVAFLVDGEEIFGAMAEAMERARRSILLVGWDFHSGVRLRRGEEGEPTLVEFLNRLVARRPELHVEILEWDFSMIYALEREPLPALRFGTSTHERVHFELDGIHPPGASHHLKLVVVDDAVAFSGGLDLAPCRWDTREHRADDPRRSDPGFARYRPFHDVQMLVDGDAARALGELARERWRRGTGRRSHLGPAEGDPWPPGVQPHLRDVEVGMARTQPEWEDLPEAREVESLLLESIRRAERWLYLEDQYLTSRSVGRALEARLAEERGPEVVIVASRRCSGWLEEGTMGTLRTRLLRGLREADRYGRLRACHPVVPGLGEDFIKVHSKVLVADDRLLRVGSANLSNRSMGLDTELDLAVEAGAGQDGVRRAIARFRDGLLAEHLGVRPQEVTKRLEETGSLVETVDALAGGERTLVRLDSDVPEWLDAALPEDAVVDSEQPLEMERVARDLLPPTLAEREPRRNLRRVALPALVVVGLAILWRFTPLSEVLRPEDLAALAAPLREGTTGPLLFTGLFAVGGALMFPVTVLIVAAALVFGPWLGFATALTGCLLSAVLGYGAGRLLWRDAVHRLMGPRLRRLSQQLGRRGVLTVAAVRVVPVAPFTAVNLVAGATHVQFRDFLLGTVLAMTPGVLAMTAVADRLAAAVARPGWNTAVALVAVAVVALGGLFLLRRRLAAETGADA